MRLKKDKMKVANPSGDLLEHKNFYGTAEFSLADNCLHGRVIGIPDMIAYEGKDSKLLMQDFKVAVDDYIIDQSRLERPLRKSYTGHFSVRITSQTHQKLDFLAAAQKTSVSKIIEEAFSKE